MKIGIRSKLFLLSLSLIVVALFVAYVYLSSTLGYHLTDTIRTNLFAALILALVLAAFMSIIATQLASRNIRSLTMAARSMADGDLSVRIPIAGKDEFAVLAQTLSHLAQSLSKSIADLRSERDLLGGILTGMNEGVLLLDLIGRVILMNPALREMFFVRSDAVGQPLLEVVRHAELKAIFDRVIASASPILHEIEIVGLKPRLLLVHASKIVYESRILLVFVDVTDIRRLESMRRDFVANASHELRTPVASARSALETIRRAMIDDPRSVPVFLDIVERNVERLHLLIEDLLDLARIESNEFKLAKDQVSLPLLLTSVFNNFGNRALQKQIALHQDIPPNLPPLEADRRALDQILSNLIDNAIKYCPPGSDVSVRAVVDGSLFHISVEDSGPGIDPKHLPRLFERFYRVDPGRSRELGGTGLGLSIVKHLAEAMGGVISVESAFGRGTVFSLTLPFLP